jgi:hypothetical protein
MSTAPILYLCGPMTGLPHKNHPAFIAAAERLRGAGYLVVSPVDNGLLPDAPWISHMRTDIAMMVSVCDAVATLPGCESSKGARIEIPLATGLGWKVASVDDWLEWARVHRELESELQP